VHTRSSQSTAINCLRFTRLSHPRLFKTVFPAGLDGPTGGTGAPQTIARKPSTASLAVPESAAPAARSGFFGRWGGGSSSANASASNLLAVPGKPETPVADGPIDDLVVSGVAFGACMRPLHARRLSGAQGTACSTSSSRCSPRAPGKRRARRLYAPPLTPGAAAASSASSASSTTVSWRCARSPSRLSAATFTAPSPGAPPPAPARPRALTRSTGWR
jgi:hypothetical protein